MQQCIAWPGTIVASLYIPLTGQSGRSRATAMVESTYAAALPSIFPNSSFAAGATLQHLYDTLVSQQATIEQQGACSLNILLYTEVLPAKYNALKALQELYTFPINALRNRAILHTNTEFMLYADGDFLPGPTDMLRDMLHHGHGFGTMPLAVLHEHLRNCTVVVAPAFRHGQGEPSMQQVQALVNMPSKQGLGPLLASGVLRDFQRVCQRMTNSSQWIRGNETYAVPMRCDVQVRVWMAMCC